MKTLNGQLYIEMINSGLQYLSNNKTIVDAMNVFPVPDGDTGTNMTLTMKSVAREISEIKDDSLDNIATAISKGALKGARGNSGVILSQIFKGINDIIVETRGDITTKVFAEALDQGAKVAYSAVNKPQEGTILTVIRMISKHATSIAGRTQEFDKFMDSVLSKGYEVLALTPEMLPVLKKANTVDAGGKGLLCIIEGFCYAIKGIEVEVKEEVEAFDSASQVLVSTEQHDLDNIEFAYCTEFIITNLRPRITEVQIDLLRDNLCKIGDCVLVIGDLALVKVHVHTNKPDKALLFALRLGELERLKIENMLQQARELNELRESEKVDKAMLSICAGDGNKAIFKDLGVSEIVEGGQTMNPSVDDILNAIERVNSDVVYVLPNNSNIIFAAEQASQITKKKCYVVPTKYMQQGISACLVFDDTMDDDELFNEMKESYSDLPCGQVSHAVRNVKMDGHDLKKGDIIGLDGKHILAKGKDVDEVVIKLIEFLFEQKKGETDQITLYYGKDIDIKDAEELVAKIIEIYPDLEVISLYGGQPHYYYFISLD